MSINKKLEALKIQKNNGYAKNDKSINDMIVKQKFSKLFVLMRDKDNLNEVRYGLHASSIIKSDGEFCLRQQVLSLLFEMEQGEELPVKALQIFAAGESIHEKWQTMLDKCTGKKGNSIKLIRNESRSYNEKYELLFTPDSIVEIDGLPYIVEYKSMNTYAFKSALSATNPHPSARKQIQLYMFLTGIENGIILIEDKNTQDFMTYLVKFNYKEVLPFIDRLNEIKECKKEFLENGILPKRDKRCVSANNDKPKSCNMCAACFNIRGGRKPLNG